MIHVTKPYLPQREKYDRYVDRIYASNWLTNNGPLVQELEERLCDHLGVKNLLLVSNGTVALNLAYHLLALDGEVITTPFSFVATTSSIVWEGLDVTYADIDPETLTIDPEKLERQISDNTSAIVPVHVFGNGCDVEAIDRIAKRHGLKVVYDAAHAFGTTYNGQSILEYGDVSTISFHATKLFHTIEGGALIIKDDVLYRQAKQMINFGFENQEIEGVGINAKMNEFQAAMGLCVLDDMAKVTAARCSIWEAYVAAIGTLVSIPTWRKGCSNNFSYFPILLRDEDELLRVQVALNDRKIIPRRYFYPSLETLKYLPEQEEMPVSNEVAARILCLPLYPDLSKDETALICETIREVLA
ncbi:DegT/DnrJ/EryC1/StrS family aminotransferase [Sulfurimonas sp. ST-25]|uniref:DegT/DnrJ/EryC1/StrS family aminotransferase n=1 Tax=Sulfurimonas sp. ST-25 TaxID=3400151 RepID=UPI003A87DE21